MLNTVFLLLIRSGSDLVYVNVFACVHVSAPVGIIIPTHPPKHFGVEMKSHLHKTRWTCSPCNDGLYDFAQIHTALFEYIVEYKSRLYTLDGPLRWCYPSRAPSLHTTDPKCIVQLIYKTRVYGSYTLFNAYIQSFRIVFGVTCIRPLEYMYMPCGLRIHVETVADFVSGRAYTTFTQYTVIYVMKPVEYMKGETSLIQEENAATPAHARQDAGRDLLDVLRGPC